MVLIMSKDLNVAIAGITGAVGQEILRLLEDRDFPVGQVKALASSRSVGKKFPFRGGEITVEELTADSFAGVDLALFSAGSGISKEFAPGAVENGCVVVDNSSAFRGDAETPLVVPEINAADVAAHQGIVANPNCSTAIAVMALYPLHQAFGLTRVIASTYQAVSGSGAGGIVELERQVKALAEGGEIETKVYPHQIAYNALPHVDSFQNNGYTKEEMKLVHEGRKIMHLPEFQASVTCVRVPVYRAHSISVTAAFEKPVDINAAREAIKAFPGVDMEDWPGNNVYPTPLRVSGLDNCKVGRLRKDLVFENGLTFWVVGDQLLKGAALNAVQIAEELVRRDLVKG